MLPKFVPTLWSYRGHRSCQFLRLNVIDSLLTVSSHSRSIAAFTVLHYTLRRQCRKFCPKYRVNITAVRLSYRVSLYCVCLCWCTVPPVWEKRTALVIYERDSPHHVDVVRQFTRLLQTHCNFRIVSEMTRQEQIRLSKCEFVLDSIDEADVVLVVVSEHLRTAWWAQRRYNQSKTTADSRLPSVGELLLQRLRMTDVFQPRSRKVAVVRFDYTPAMTDVDTRLASVSHVYELMRDIDRLLSSLRGVSRHTQMLTMACCVRPANDDVDVSRLRESVAFARQHCQQRQVRASTGDPDVVGRDDDISLSSEHTNLLNIGVYETHGVADNLPLNVTGGAASGRAEDDTQPADNRDAAPPPEHEFHRAHHSSRMCSSVVSLQSLYVDQQISQFNEDYDAA